MKITPIDISHKSFSKKIRGYDPDEVYDFLQSVSEAFAEVVRDRNQLKEAVRQKEILIMEYKGRDEVLKKTITTATQMADKMCEDSEKNAQVIISDAQRKGDMIIREAQDSLSGYYREIGELKKVYSKFDAQLRAGIQTHLALLDQMRDFLPEANSKTERTEAEINA